MVGQLDDFCEMIRSNYGSPDAISPGDLAGVFVSHSGLSSSPSFMELHSILRRYGVAEITAADLRAGRLKGHHFSYKDQEYTVLFEENLWTGSVELRWPPSLGQDRGNIKVGFRYPQGVWC